MKILMCLLLMYVNFFSLQAQTFKKTKDSCSCSIAGNVKVPEVDEDSSISGTVMVSFEVDSNCAYSNAKIEKSLSPLHDAAVLKMMNEILVKLNKCLIGCPVRQPCEKKKWFQPVTFCVSEE